MNSQHLKQLFLGPDPERWYNASGWLNRDIYLFLKRFLDISISLLLLPVAAPLILGGGLAQKLTSPGPILFLQKRTGRGGRRFTLYKLRTMVADAEKLKVQYRSLNSMSGPDFKIENDPRVTSVGWFLRRTSLDELPQLLNVIKGDMSLVGPRPTSFPAETYSLWQTARLEVKPGLTGLWQISGRSNVDFDERLRLDIAYIQNQCLSLDLKILLRTGAAVFRGEGAH